MIADALEKYVIKCLSEKLKIQPETIYGLRVSLFSLLILNLLFHPAFHVLHEFGYIMQLVQVVVYLVPVYIQIIMNKNIPKPCYRCQLFSEFQRKYASLAQPHYCLVIVPGFFQFLN